MQRRYLRPLKLKNRGKDFFVFDTETGEKLSDGTIKYFLSARPEHFIFGVVYGKDFIKVIHSLEAFKKEFLKRKYKNKIVYAHNAEYDLSVLYGNIYYLDPDAIFNGKFITCTNGNCKFADSHNLLPTSIAELGEMIGNKKQELGSKKDKDGNIISHIKRIKQDVEYCITDCKIAYDSLAEMFSDAEPSFTIGSLSLKKFRTDFLKETIKVNTISDKFFDALYGGRTEAFKLGKTEAFVYDLNSAYPWALKNLKFPNPSRLRTAPNTKYEQYLNDLNFEGMIEATVTIDESCNIPVLPWRTDNSLIFPVGTFRGSWTFNEFRYAREVTPLVINKVHKVIISEGIESPFVEYIDHFYLLRSQTTNKFKKYYYKLYMNNLYGKLIQRLLEKFRYCDKISTAKSFMKKNKIKHVNLIEVNKGYFLKYEVYEILSHTIACWGAYITAEVRKMLHKQIMLHPDETVYCDTDSTFITKNLDLNSSELGGWKKEEKIVTEVRALKDYICVEYDKKENKWNHKEYLKGIKKGSVPFDQLGNVFEIKRMIKTRESFRRVDNLPPGTFIKQIKVLTGDYTKRKKLPDGNTKPFKLTLATKPNDTLI